MENKQDPNTQPNEGKKNVIFATERKHTVRHKDGGFITINKYSKTRAIALMCSECCGFESNPQQCPIKECPLFPYRRATTLNRIRTFGNSTPETETEEEEENEV